MKITPNKAELFLLHEVFRNMLERYDYEYKSIKSVSVEIVRDEKPRKTKRSIRKVKTKKG